MCAVWVLGIIGFVVLGPLDALTASPPAKLQVCAFQFNHVEMIFIGFMALGPLGALTASQPAKLQVRIRHYLGVMWKLGIQGSRALRASPPHSCRFVPAIAHL